MRILHISAPSAYGGLERVVVSLAAGQHARGHEVHVAAILDTGTRASGVVLELEELGIDTHPLAVEPRAYLRERRLVGNLCSSLEPDIVHTHGYRCDVLHGGVARRNGIPVVATVHGFTGGGWKNSFYEFLQRRAYRAFDAVVAVSRPQLEQLAAEGIPRNRLHWVPNAHPGVDALPALMARSRLGLADDEVHVGFIGRLNHEKGPDLFLEAVAALDHTTVAVIVGDGRMQRDLEELAQRLGIEDRVVWAGAQPDAARLMRAFDVLVLSSRTEGTPIVLLEGMSAGVPIVATRVGGVPDVVTERHAALVQPEDHEALARAIDSVLADQESAQARCQLARDRLQSEFGLDRWVDRYDDVYREVCLVGVDG